MRRRPGVTRATVARMICLTAVLALVVPVGAAAQAPPWDQDPAVGQRAQALLDQMTLQEKVDLVTGEVNGNYGFYNNGNERLGIPPMKAADGPVGVRISNPAVHDLQVHAAALGAGARVDVRRRACLRLRRAAGRRGAQVGLQHDARADDRPRARSVQPARVRDVLRGPAAHRPARSGGHQRHPEQSRRRSDAQALQPQHPGAPSRPRQRDGRRAHAAGALHAPVGIGRSTRPTRPRPCARSRPSTGPRRVRTRRC